MRLLKRGLKPVHVFKSETVDSGYVGTESVDLLQSYRNVPRFAR